MDNKTFEYMTKRTEEYKNLQLQIDRAERARNSLIQATQSKYITNLSVNALSTTYQLTEKMNSTLIDLLTEHIDELKKQQSLI